MSTVTQVHHRPSINKSSKNSLFCKAIKDLNNNNEKSANKSGDSAEDLELPISDSEGEVAVSPKKKNTSNKPKKQVLNENLVKVLDQNKKVVKKENVTVKVEPAGDSKVSIQMRKINKSPEKTKPAIVTKTNTIPKPQVELKDLDQQIENTKQFLEYVEETDVLKKTSVKALHKSRKDLIKELKEYLQFWENMKIK